MARTFYFADVFTKKFDDKETIDELLDAGFPGTTEVDVVSSNYYTASNDGMTMGIANRVHDIPVRMPRLGDTIVEKDGNETAWKIHDFDHVDKLLTLVNKANGEAKQIDLRTLQNNFVSVD